jgi:ribA/ribD-fused uncharacterized protein
MIPLQTKIKKKGREGKMSDKNKRRKPRRAPQKILEFRGRYAFLSNFFFCTVEFEGDEYKSVEHAFQAAKTEDRNTRALIKVSPLPRDAKFLGRKIRLSDIWDEDKVDVMRGLIRAKFKNRRLAKMLLKTGRAEIVEGNTWGDTFWGKCEGKGENLLGKILMEIRLELREKESEKKENVRREK